MSSAPPRSPSLEPPRKSVELEDPGAHSLDTTSDEDEFSDAREALASPTRPVTRVERIDSTPAHGEVPGTAAYDQRTADAEPDHIAFQSHKDSTSTTDAKNQKQAAAGHDLEGSSANVPVPRTVITRIDSQPAHGEVPGTKAAKLRQADAEPDVVEKRGDVPSKSHERLKPTQQVPDRSRSPIAADGGFGHPASSEDEYGEDETPQTELTQANILPDSPAEPDSLDSADGFGDDFDEFAEGEEADDFGDFDDGFEASEEPETAPPPKDPIVPIKLPYPVLDFSNTPSLQEIEQMVSPHLPALFPSLESDREAGPPNPLPEGNTAFLSDRSHKLWQQLIEPPDLQPPNWVRSRVRRLFLVSLGVPVDLDEILPKSKQKKLVLSYDPADQASKAGAKKDTKAVASKDQPPKRTRGPPPPPEFDLDEVKKMCRLTDADLNEMSDETLQAHVEELTRLATKGKEVLQYWVKRKEMAVDEKEAFDSVVESLVRHARRVRK